MHRLAAVPGSTSSNEGPVFIEQPPAALVVLSSADTDLTALASLLACWGAVGTGVTASSNCRTGPGRNPSGSCW
jgi:cobaltochelatase CobN